MSQKNEPNNVISLNRNQMYKYEMHRNSKARSFLSPPPPSVYNRSQACFPFCRFTYPTLNHSAQFYCPSIGPHFPPSPTPSTRSPQPSTVQLSPHPIAPHHPSSCYRSDQIYVVNRNATNRWKVRLKIELMNNWINDMNELMNNWINDMNELMNNWIK